MTETTNKLVKALGAFPDYYNALQKDYKQLNLSYKQSVQIAVIAAELVIDIWASNYPNDNRPQEAINVAKSWIINPSAAYAANAVNAAINAAYAVNAANAAAYAAYTAYAASAVNAAYAANATTYAAYATTYAANVKE